MALPLAWQIVNSSGWVAWQVTNIFENVGVVQEGMMTIAAPIALDRPARRAGRSWCRAARSPSRTCASATAAKRSAREDGRLRPYAVLQGSR